VSEPVAQRIIGSLIGVDTAVPLITVPSGFSDLRAASDARFDTGRPDTI
jgi:hypothetical protein